LTARVSVQKPGELQIEDELMVRTSGYAGWCFVLSLAAVFPSSAQLVQPRAGMPTFEVVSVKPWIPAPPIVGADGPQRPVKVAPTGAAPAITDRVHFIGQIELLIQSAYGLSPALENRIQGGPEWMRSEGERYEVTGKIDAARYAAMQKMSATEQREQVSLMEQSLLADRFQLKAHIETRKMPRYALVVAKGGLRMERAADGTQSRLSFARNSGESEIQATAVSMEELARAPFLRMDKREIVDRTGIEGRFNFTLKFGESVSGAPALPTALQEQIGLRLAPEDGMAEVVVIDHIERPSGN
jgi:uncharacterized protein (TIGR03435 family)